MKNKKKILSAYKRKLTIDGEVWTYRVTHRTIDVCSPDQKKKWKVFIDSTIDLSCNCCYKCECYEWYDSPKNAPVKPKFVVKVIKNQCIRDDKNVWDWDREKRRKWQAGKTPETAITVDNIYVFRSE